MSGYGNSQVKEYFEKTDCLISAGVVYGGTNSYGTPFPFKLDSHILVCGTHTYIEGKRYDNIKMKDVFKELAKAIKHHSYKVENVDFGYEETVSGKEKLESKYIYSRLQKFFKEGDVIFAETGLIPQGIAQMKLPDNCSLNSQLLWNSAGWATSAALGAAVACPDSRVILITGDGAHLASGMETGVMSKYGLKPIIVVINNKGYSVNRFLSGSDGDFNDVAQFDFAKFARSFKGDIWSTKVETAGDFDKALRVTQIMDKLCYIEAVVDKDDLPEIAAGIFKGITPQRQPVKTKEKNNAGRGKKKGEKLTVSTDEKYETSVHASLKDIDE